MRSALAPCESFSEVVRSVVPKAEVCLRVGVTLFGGLALPVGSLRVVLRQTLTGVVHRTQEVLRLGVALLSSTPESRSSFNEVAGVVVGGSLPVVRVGSCVRGIAAAAGDDAGARGVERQRGAGRDVLQTAFGFIFHGRFVFAR